MLSVVRIVGECKMRPLFAPLYTRKIALSVWHDMHAEHAGSEALERSQWFHWLTIPHCTFHKRTESRCSSRTTRSPGRICPSFAIVQKKHSNTSTNPFNIDELLLQYSVILNCKLTGRKKTCLKLDELAQQDHHYVATREER